MKYFCSNCGKTTMYNFELPKFCAFCGESFGNKQSSVKAEESRGKFLNQLQLNKKNINDNTEETIEEEINPNLNFKKIKAKYKIDVYQSKGESFGDLIENPAPLTNHGNSHKQNKSKDEILAEFQKEAGALRSK